MFPAKHNLKKFRLHEQNSNLIKKEQKIPEANDNGASINRARSRVFTFVQVQIPQGLGRLLRERHLVVVVDHPPPFPLDVADIVANHRRGPHVRNKSGQFVFWGAIREFGTEEYNAKN